MSPPVLGVKPGKPEAAGERELRMRRREPVRVADPGLGAQVFEHEPRRRRRRSGHRGDIARGQPAAERFDHDIGGIDIRKGLAPTANRHARDGLQVELWLDARSNPGERAEIVLPQPHLETVLGDELSCEAPADARVAEVVDDLAEDVPPALSWRHEGGSKLDREAGARTSKRSHYRLPCGGVPA
jgi:hypothetical protein